MLAKPRITLPSTPLCEGIWLLDKPPGLTSHDVVDQVRRQSGIKRVGHAGTLDPLATGLLIILVGRNFTKRQAEFLKQDKEYVCTAQLGIQTDTYDADGTVVQTAPWSSVQHLTRTQVESVMKKFTGAIEQRVPVYSAVKVAGQKMYNRARQGEAVPVSELPTRAVNIYELELIEYQVDASLHQTFITFRVKCSSGTYVRSLASDLGNELGCGATVVALRRTKIGLMEVPLKPKLISENN